VKLFIVSPGGGYAALLGHYAEAEGHSIVKSPSEAELVIVHEPEGGKVGAIRRSTTARIIVTLSFTPGAKISSEFLQEGAFKVVKVPGGNPREAIQKIISEA